MTTGCRRHRQARHGLEQTDGSIRARRPETRIRVPHRKLCRHDNGHQEPSGAQYQRHARRAGPLAATSVAACCGADHRRIHAHAHARTHTHTHTTAMATHRYRCRQHWRQRATAAAARSSDTQRVRTCGSIPSVRATTHRSGGDTAPRAHKRSELRRYRRRRW